MVVVDYRMPGLDGAQTTAAVLRASPGDARRLPDRVGLARPRSSELLAAGAVACVTKDEELERIVDAIHAAAEPSRAVKLTAENTAIVLDSTADFPEGPARFPNWRVVPLYVQLRRARASATTSTSAPDEFYERLARRPSRRRRRSRRPATSSPSTRSSRRGYERMLSLQLSSTLSGTFASAEAAAAASSAARCA